MYHRYLEFGDPVKTLYKYNFIRPIPIKSSLALILVHVLKEFHLKIPLLIFLPPFPYHSNYNLSINVQTSLN